MRGNDGQAKKKKRKKKKKKEKGKKKVERAGDRHRVIHQRRELGPLKRRWRRDAAAGRPASHLETLEIDEEWRLGSTHTGHRRRTTANRRRRRRRRRRRWETRGPDTYGDMDFHSRTIRPISGRATCD